MNTRLLIASLWLVAGLCSAGSVLADTPIYKWVDDQGRVHYSTEPHGDKAQQLAIQNQGNSASPPAGTAAGAAGAKFQNDALLVQPQATDSPACKVGRDQLFKYLHADNLFTKDDKGNKVSLSAEDKKKALDQQRAYVTQVCSGGGA